MTDDMKQSMSYNVNGRILATDDRGFLVNLDEWDAEVAAVIAGQLGITLTDAHWPILHLLRDLYIRFDLAPTNRALVKVVKERLGEQQGNSIYLMQLFGGHAARDAAKIAGLPKPPHCL